MRQPNILFILTDQQRADTIHAAGNPFIRTPTMDRLCREGVRFNRAYTPSPVCVSARACILTGQYPHKSGCYDNGFPQLEDSPSMMDLLAAAGYQCHGVGKMHFQPDANALRGFHSRDTQEELCGSVEEDDYLGHLQAAGFDHVHDVMGARGEMYYIPQVSQLPARLHPSHWVADRSIDFLNSRDHTKPFFLWSSYIHPHPPFSPPTPWNKLYRGPNMPRPKRPDYQEDLWTYFNRWQNRYKYRDQGLDYNLLRVMKAYYWACVSFIDYNVGRILSRLEEIDELDNTLIAWTSDHGEFLGDYSCFGKRSFLDAAANVPLLARLPGRFPAGQVEDTPCSLIDLIPTFLGAAEAARKDLLLDGVDLAELVGKAEDRTVYGQIQRGGRANYMACNQRLKYIYSAPDQKEYLLDHQVDPEETRNLAGNTFYAADLENMRQRLIHFLESQRLPRCHRERKLDRTPQTPNARLPRRRTPDPGPRLGGTLQEHPGLQRPVNHRQVSRTPATLNRGIPNLTLLPSWIVKACSYRVKSPPTSSVCDTRSSAEAACRSTKLSSDNSTSRALKVSSLMTVTKMLVPSAAIEAHASIG